jgi:hypothetical protein
MLTVSVYLVPLPPGHVGARAISSVALSAVVFIVMFIAASAAALVFIVSEGFIVGVSLRLAMLPAVVSSTDETSFEAMVTKDFDVDSEDGSLDDAISASLFSGGQTTFGSQAFFEQHLSNPVDGQEL